MPNHELAPDTNRHPCSGASTATEGQVIKAGGSDTQSWVSFGGDVSGPPDVLRVNDLTITSEAHGDLLYRGASAWLRLAAGGTADSVLTTGGAGAAPAWRSHLRVNATGVGFYGTTPVAQPTLAAASTDLASVITLANDIRSKLIAFGLTL